MREVQETAVPAQLDRPHCRSELIAARHEHRGHTHVTIKGKSCNWSMYIFCPRKMDDMR